MPPPSDIQQRIQAAKAKGFTDAQIQADMQRKYGTSVSTAPELPKAESMTEVGGGLGMAGQIAGVKNIGQLGGAIGLFASKDKKRADVSAQALADLNDKLFAHAMQLPSGERRDQLLRQVQEQSGQVSAYHGSLNKSVPTGKQIAGDVGQLALTATGMKMPVGSGLFRTQQMGSKIAPTAVNGLLKQIALSKVPQAMALGGASGATEAFSQGKGAKDIATSGLKSGLTSGGITTGFGLVGKLIGALGREGARAGYKVSTGLQNKADADILLNEGVTGGRDRLKDRGYRLIENAVDTKKALPSYGAKQDISTIAQSPEVQGMFDRAKLAGGTEQLNRTLQEIPGLPTSQVFGQTVIKNKQVTNGFLDKLKQALDSDTSNAVLSGGRTTSQDIGLRKSISDNIRGMLPEDIGAQNARVGAGSQLIDAIKKYGNKPSSLGMGWNALMQKTLFRPGLATQVAKGAWNLGHAGDSAKAQTLYRALRQVLTRGSGLVQ